MQWIRRFQVSMGLALCAQLLVQLPVQAKDTNRIWGSIQDREAILYIQDATVPSDLECQIGSTAVEVSEITPISDLEVPIETYILIDNSMSIREDERPIVQDILEDLVGNRMNGEMFSIAYLADGADWQCEGQTDYLQIKSVIDDLEFRLQETQLTDTLYDVISDLEDSDQGTLRRVIVIADGMDHKQLGYTRQELETLVQQVGYPIYTIGCTNTEENGQELLENYFALSRLTNATSVYLAEEDDATEIVSDVTDWNDAYRLTVELPDSLCDGAAREVLLKEGEREFTTSLTMPFAVVDAAEREEDAETEAVETTEPGIQEQAQAFLAEHQELLVWIAIGVAAVVLVVLLIMLIRRLIKGRRRQPEPVAEETVLQEESTVLLQEQGQTAYLWGDGSGAERRLLLRDMGNSDRSYDAALVGTVAIGRDANQCRIVVDYDMSVARHQCDVYMEGSRVMIRNCSTSNITRVNGNRIYDPVVLESGSTIDMGRVRMAVEIIG